MIGVGNTLLRDEGVGVHVVNAIKKRYTFSPEVEIVDGGTMGLDLLPLFEGKDKILIIDAVDFKREPGYIDILEKEAIPSTLNSKLSVHHINLSDVLFALKLMDLSPDICLIGIQPKSIEIGLDLTEEVESRMDELIDNILKILIKWNVKYYRNYEHIDA